MFFQEDLPVTPLLLDDDILYKIFSYFDYNVLDICRQVCSKWQSSAQKLWVKKSPIVEVKRDLQTCSRKAYFWKGQTKTAKWASTNYDKFRVVAFPLSNTSSWKVFYKLMNTHGELLTSLEIVDFCITNEDTLKAIFSCKFTPQLQTLKLVQIDFSFLGRSNKDSYLQVLDDDYSSSGVSDGVVHSMRRLEISYGIAFKNLPLNWRNVFETFIHLESLVLEDYSPCSRSEITRVIRGIRAFQMKHDKIHPLKSLDITRLSIPLWLRFPEDMLAILRTQAYYGKIIKRRMSLTLHNFAFSMYSEQENDSLELLSLLQNGLKRLKITLLDDYSTHLPFHVELPPMAQLTRLDLIDVYITNFFFLVDCKNLRHLNVIAPLRKSHPGDHLTPTKIGSPGWRYDRNRESMLLPGIISFHCTVELNWDNHDIKRLHNCMPNLSSLMISATRSSFAGICKYFTKLKRLFLYNSEVDDMAFTGTYVISQLLPNITYLKDLQILGVRSLCDCALCSAVELPTQLTEFAVTHGLLKTSINVLYISLGMTMNGFRALQDYGFAGKVVSRGVYSPEKFISLAITPF